MKVKHSNFEGQYRFLFVEDELIAQVIGRHVIEECGYSLDVAESSLKAIELLKDNQYHLIFLDLGLPDIAGTELIKLLREQFNLNVPIIAITAFDSASKKSECVKLGFNDFLEKPFNQD